MTYYIVIKGKQTIICNTEEEYHIYAQYYRTNNIKGPFQTKEEAVLELEIHNKANNNGDFFELKTIQHKELNRFKKFMYKPRFLNEENITLLNEKLLEKLELEKKKKEDEIKKQSLIKLKKKKEEIEERKKLLKRKIDELRKESDEIQLEDNQIKKKMKTIKKKVSEKEDETSEEDESVEENESVEEDEDNNIIQENNYYE